MGHDLRLERLIDATPEEVFDAFTDPEAQREWYMEDPAGVVLIDENEVREGRTQNIAFGTSTGELYREINVFSEVAPPHRLAYTSTFVFPDGNSFETAVVVTFEPQDGKTLFTVVQTGYPDEETRDGHLSGWPNFIDRLAQVVAKRKAA